MEQIAAGKGRAPSPFMLGGPRKVKADAIWHSNKSGEQGGLTSPSKQAGRRKTQPGGTSVPQFVAPQLCKLVSRAPTGEDWVHEIKFDGYRMQLRVEGGQAELRTRKGLDWTSKFQSIAEAASGLPDVLIDGEVVALGHNGAPDFAALQAAISEGRSRDLTYFAFDLLFSEGADLRGRPLTDRKSRLEKYHGGAAYGEFNGASGLGAAGPKLLDR
jgi:bifunctional non-homologous end joining protein LigD